MNKKLIVFSVIYIAILLFTASIISSITTSENLSQKILRFHVLANSDVDCDQELKLKVRDEVLKYSKNIYDDCKDVEDAVKISKDNIDDITTIANNVIKNNGYDYKAKAYIVKEFYNTREYSDFTLPAGIYDSLKIVIGNGEGHNWWCVVFPTVCLSGCTDEFDEYLTDKEKQMITNDKYVLKFKIVEIYEKIKFKIKRGE